MVNTVQQVNFKGKKIFVDAIAKFSCRFIFKDYNHQNVLAGKGFKDQHVQ